MTTQRDCGQLLWFPLLHQCVTVMAPGHVGCLVSWRNVTEWMGPYSVFYSPECEEQLKTSIHITIGQTACDMDL